LLEHFKTFQIISKMLLHAHRGAQGFPPLTEFIRELLDGDDMDGPSTVPEISDFGAPLLDL
jgi:hypothetical protein